MLFKSVALATFFAATSVLADGAAIVSSLSIIRTDTAKLNATLESWDGSLFGALPILGSSSDLSKAIENGTAVANASAPLTTDESLAVYNAVTALSGDVNITLENFIAAKPKFDKAGVTFIATNNLQSTKTDTDQFGAAVVAKVPAALQSFAQTVVTGIDASFEKVLAVYQS